VVSGADYVTGHDPETGRELWRVPGLNPSANPMQRVVASPVVSGSMIFVPSRVDPLLALSAGGGDGGTAPEVIWSTTRGPDVPTPAVTEDYVFILTDNGVLWCLDAESGDVVWGPERVEPSTYSASPVVADGKLYVTNEAGLTTVVEAGPEFRVLGRSSVDEYTLSSLAVAGGQLFLRTAEHLYCIGEPG
jgi:outer membrane protein assembly factor BamB